HRNEYRGIFRRRIKSRIKDVCTLQPKTAIVTGASSGIGKAIAEKLAAKKINVALVARSEDTLISIAKELTNKYGTNVIALPTDVSNQAEVEKMVKQAKDAFGFIDVYVNNAGVMLEDRKSTRLNSSHDSN